MDVQQCLEKYIEATNSHDFKNVLPYIDEEAVFWFTKDQYIGISEVERYFNNTWSLIKDEVYSISDVTWIVLEENVSVCLYLYHWEGYYRDNFVSGYGKATNVFRKKNGKWLLVHEHLTPLSN